MEAPARHRGRPTARMRTLLAGWRGLLLVPVIATLATPLYASHDPELFGVPFFYAYQLAWIPLSMLCMAVVYRATRREGDG